MRYIEATTISQPILHKTKDPLIIKASGQRLVIRADIICEQSDVIIIADDLIVDRCNVQLLSSDESNKPLLHIIVNGTVNILGANIKSTGDIKVNAIGNIILAPSPQDMIRDLIHDGAYDFYVSHHMGDTIEALGLVGAGAAAGAES